MAHIAEEIENIAAAIARVSRGYAQYIPQETAEYLIDYTGGRIFYVEFIKKDGTLRKMTARKEVHKYVTGAGMKYDPRAIGLIPVFDMDKRAWRMVNVKTCLRIHAGGQKFTVSNTTT